MFKEIDWMKFFWEVNTSGTAAQQMTIAELLDVIREGTVFPDTDTAFVGALSQGTTYSDLVDAMEDIYGKGSDKELYFNEVSDKAGIDMNLNN